MTKKIIIIPFIFLLIHFCYIACICNCPDIKEKYFKVSDITVKSYADDNVAIDSGLATTDTITLKYDFARDCIAYHENPFSVFVNTILACSCKGCGDDGIKSKIKTFEITSDSVYNGIPANTSLNGIFRVRSWAYFDIYDNKTLDTVKTLINNRYGFGRLSLFSIVKPLDAKGHRFTLRMITEDNMVKTATTKQIFWH